ncbi:MAG: cell division protein FtsA [Deltaproteobacteria bacterium]|nr:cell division protein FtsA [Deltaproteobacteria bacterium]
MARREEIVVGLDIGTTKVCCVVGQATDDGIDIIGIGSHPSKGLRKGVVVNIEQTVASIQRAVEEAEQMAGVEISTVYAGIAGGHIKGFNSSGVVAVRDKEIGAHDVDRVLDAAKAIAIPVDREVVHALPQEFIVDNQDGIHEPVGMNGVRLEAKVHIVTGSVSSAQNIVKCAQRCDLTVADIVLEQLASSYGVLSEDEKEIGVALVDIGGGTTDIVLFVDGSVMHTAVIPLGGLNLTQDIATGLRTPIAEAEAIKQKHGCALTSLVDPEEEIEVPSVGGRPARSIKRRVLCEIVEPRVEEIFQLVRAEIANTGYHDLLASGAVITGGATIMEGMPEMAEDVLGLPVRRASPTGIGGLADVVKNPMYATAVGLVMYGANEQRGKPSVRVTRPGGEDRVVSKIGRRVSDWLREVF